MPCRALLLCLATLCLQAGSPPFQKAGKGPGILLIHGFGGNKEVWAGVAAELAQDHTVLSVDLPGSGGTPGPVVVEGRADFGAVAKDLAALVRKEGLAPCLVVGHSMGGPIAARAALEDPGAFRGLILVDSFLGALPAAYMEPTITGLEADPALTLAVFMGHVSAGPAQNERVVAEALRVPVAVLQAYLRGMTLDPLAARQGELRLPVLQLAAGRRETDPAREAATLAQFGFKGLPAFRMIHFPGARHWIMWDAPEAFLVAVRAFEAGLGR
ncbi:MAG: alpha/beta fold hydrolase [Geothrix sp.]|uniref:alpha/beta fold hydrolase n=1 Tax=Geothrix sp. TaxID=1962974 RepID=UPI0017B3A7AA|nr:alpha/beta fold hydrolase [Geothrix sp.]NWJ40400.1 alpha/beta fold hydrolase [Geothrix sp.]WIL21593.1 MAG: alpha/beta fold hydrolase [Geothrix sp.]